MEHKEESVELKRRLDPRVIFVGLYMLALAVYVVVGLQPAEATDYDVSARLEIPAIGLDSDVTALERNGNQLDTPDTIVGAYSQAENKTLLVGHSTTVFTGLSEVALGDTVRYADVTYRVVAIDMMPKTDISMGALLKASDRDTLVIMTCAGRLLGGGDATHRLIVTAVRTE